MRCAFDFPLKNKKKNKQKNMNFWQEICSNFFHIAHNRYFENLPLHLLKRERARERASYGFR